MSENFYFLLQNLEVTLRNAIYDSYTNCSQFSKPFFYLREQNTTKPYNREFHSYACWKMIGTVKHNLQKNSVTVTDGKIISELNFGFWVNLFQRPYQDHLRIKELKLIFPYMPSKATMLVNREEVYKKLDHIRNFRNRIFHYEKVINKDHFSDILNEIHFMLNNFNVCNIYSNFAFLEIKNLLAKISVSWLTSIKRMGDIDFIRIFEENLNT